MQHACTALFTTLLCLFWQSKATACFYEPPENRFNVTFFNPDLLEDTSYRHCYYGGLGESWEHWPTPDVAGIYKANLLEWQKHFKNEPPLAHIGQLMYQTEQGEIDALLIALLNKKNLFSAATDTLKGNQLLRYLNQKKDLEFLGYLLFAKMCEPHLESYYSWGDEQRDAQAMNELVEIGKKKYGNCKSLFVQLRYAFQIVRLAHYSGNYALALQLYDGYARPIIERPDADELTANSMYRGKCMSLKAGAHRHLGQHKEAMYWFARTFTEGEHDAENRKLALQNFKFSNESDFGDALMLCKTPGEVSALWLLRGTTAQNFDAKPLQQLCATAPQSNEAAALLLYNIGKIEREMLSPAITQPIELGEDMRASLQPPQPGGYALGGLGESIKGFFARIWRWLTQWFRAEEPQPGPTAGDPLGAFNPQAAEGRYLTDLNQVVLTTIQKGQAVDLDLWKTAGAYLGYMLKKPQQTEELLMGLSPENKAVQRQANLVGALHGLNAAAKPSPDVEQLLYLALAGSPHSKEEESYDNYSVRNRSLAAYAQACLRNGGAPKAILALDAAGEEIPANMLAEFHASDEQLAQLLNLISKPNKSAFERFLLENSRFDSGLVKEIMATRLLRKGEWGNALALLNKIPEAYWVDTRAGEDGHWWNPTHLQFNCDFESVSPIGQAEGLPQCGKPHFVEKITELEAKAKNEPDYAAKHYYHIANALYQSPFWGYVGKMWEGSLIFSFTQCYDCMPGMYPLNISEKFARQMHEGQVNFADNYGSNKLAMYYCDKALDAPTKAEWGAKAAYLGRLAQINPQASIHLGNYEDPKYVRAMNKFYADTDFYQQVLEECPGWDMY